MSLVAVLVYSIGHTAAINCHNGGHETSTWTQPAPAHRARTRCREQHVDDAVGSQSARVEDDGVKRWVVDANIEQRANPRPLNLIGMRQLAFSGRAIDHLRAAVSGDAPALRRP